MAEKILIVDDDPQALKLIGYTLHRAGYEVVVAQSGPEALAKVRSERPHLVILDIMMPDMDGYEVCRRLRADPETARLPVIMLTAKAQVEDKVTGFQVGADDYITKPVLPAELVARVKALLMRVSYTPRITPRARVLGFLGVKGGVGTTTLAVNVAIALAKGKESVLLAEIGPYVSAVSLQMGLKVRTPLAAILKSSSLDEASVEACLLSHPSGVNVLPNSEGKELPPAQLGALLSILEGKADYLVLDLGSGVREVVTEVLKHCHLVILITELEAVSLKLARKALEQLDELGIRGNRVSIVGVNRARSAISFTKSELEDFLGSELLGIITPAPELCFQANKDGIPIVFGQPHTLTAEQFMEVAKKVA